MSRRQRIAALLLSGLLSVSSTSFAAIQVSTTRIIYPLGESSVTVNMVNKDPSPRLVKLWVDPDGVVSDAAEKSDAPFVVTPPLSRVEARGGQSLRLSYVGPAPPADRESVFWLNVLDIPPDLRGAEENIVQFAMRTRLKIFLRPQGLEGNPAKAVAGLIWRKVVDHGETYLQCSNPSAFHVSLVDFTLPGRKSIRGEMIAPRGSHRFRIADPETFDEAAGGSMRTVNDFGALIRGQFQLTAGH